jgi:hypothetical protein
MLNGRSTLFSSLCFLAVYFIHLSFLTSSDFVLKKFERMGIRYSFILVKSSLKLLLRSKWVCWRWWWCGFRNTNVSEWILRVKARDIMSPRTELVAIELFDSIAELKELFIETGYSKVVVYQNSLDDIVLRTFVWFVLKLKV